MSGRHLSRIALVVALALTIFATAAAAAYAAPIPSIAGTCTNSDGSADTAHYMAVYQWIPAGGGYWSYDNQASISWDLNSPSTYRIATLPPGRYRVDVLAYVSGVQCYPGIFYGGADNLYAATDITVTAGTTAYADIRRPAPDTLNADAAEPDNRRADAASITPGASWVERTLFSVPDIDWFKFNAVAGHSYMVESGPSSVHPAWCQSYFGISDTFLTLTDSSGRQLLANDDSGLSGRYAGAEWVAPATGPYYASITTYGEAASGNPSRAAYAFRVRDLGVLGTGSISGHVTDSSTGLPISNAVVEASLPGSAPLVYLTGVDGGYTFAHLPEGDYSMRCFTYGFQNGSVPQVNLAEGQNATNDIQLAPPASPAKAWLYGSVMCADGPDAENALVELVGPSSDATISAYANGGYSFSSLSTGTYTLSISLPGYRTITHPNFEVRPANVMWFGPAFVDTLDPVGSVIGTVTSGGAPLAGVTVSDSHGDTATTALDGSYTLAEVDAGATTITFSKLGYVPGVQPVGVSRGATSTVSAVLVRAKTWATIARTPSASKKTYPRKKGSVKFTLSALLSGPNGAFATSALVLQSSANGKSGWKTVKSLTTSASGSASYTITAKKAATTYYRWYAPDGAAHSVAYSTVFKATVK